MSSSPIVVSKPAYRPQISVEGGVCPPPTDIPKFGRGEAIEIVPPDIEEAGDFDLAVSTTLRGEPVARASALGRSKRLTIPSEKTAELGDGLYTWSLFHVDGASGRRSLVGTGYFNIVTLAGSEEIGRDPVGGLLDEEING